MINKGSKKEIYKLNNRIIEGCYIQPLYLTKYYTKSEIKRKGICETSFEEKLDTCFLIKRNITSSIASTSSRGVSNCPSVSEITELKLCVHLQEPHQNDFEIKYFAVFNAVIPFVSIRYSYKMNILFSKQIIQKTKMCVSVLQFLGMKPQSIQTRNMFPFSIVEYL